MADPEWHHFPCSSGNEHYHLHVTSSGVGEKKNRERIRTPLTHHRWRNRPRGLCVFSEATKLLGWQLDVMWYGEKWWGRVALVGRRRPRPRNYGVFHQVGVPVSLLCCSRMLPAGPSSSLTPSGKPDWIPYTSSSALSGPHTAYFSIVYRDRVLSTKSSLV